MNERRSGCILLVLVSISMLFPIPKAAAGGGGNENAVLELVRVEPDHPTVGQPVAFTWRVTDPDAFTAVEEFRVDYGDSRPGRQAGTPLLCGELLHAGGLDHSFRTLHRYMVAGTYTVRAGATTRQRMCGVGLTEADTAPEVERTITVR